MKTKSRKVKSQKATADSRKRSSCRVPSRRRSLSALTAVQVKVERLRDEARHSLYWCNQYNLESGKAVHAAKERALDAVLSILAEVGREEPKANTEVSNPHSNDV